MDKILPALAIFLLGHTHASAATITYVGAVAGAEVTEWRTATTAKGLDPDGDNVYGTFASVQWLVAGLNEHPAGSTDPGWAYTAGAGQYGGYATQIDRNTGGPDVGCSIMLTQFGFELTGDLSTYAGKTVRMGVMADMLNSGEWAADQNKGYRLVQTVGGSGDSGVVSLRAGSAGDGVPEMYFFDLTGVSAGDRFLLSALNDVSGGGATQAGYLGPVSWDIVPEPSLSILGALGALGLLGRRARTAAGC